MTKNEKRALSLLLSLLMIFSTSAGAYAGEIQNVKPSESGNSKVQTAETAKVSTTSTSSNSVSRKKFSFGSGLSLSVEYDNTVSYNGKKHIVKGDKANKTSVDDIKVTLSGNVLKYAKVTYRYVNNKNSKQKSKKPSYMVISLKAQKSAPKNIKDAISKANTALKKGDSRLTFEIVPCDLTDASVDVKMNKKGIKVKKIKASVNGATFVPKKKEYKYTKLDDKYFKIDFSGNFTGTYTNKPAPEKEEKEDPKKEDSPITIDCSEFGSVTDDNGKTIYVVGENFDGTIKGSLDTSKASFSSMGYELDDDKGINLKDGSMEASSQWSVGELGLTVGANDFKVTATDKDGNVYSEEIRIMNYNPDLAGNITVDEGDNDGEGLINYLEDYYGTDKNNSDTDGDGINDYQELNWLKDYDPLKTDSDGNGVSDGQEDYDGDGVDNQTEISSGSDPTLPDTDGDGLNDNDEIFTYSTDPSKEDTDGDGASDGWEVANGYDPLSYNSSHTVTASSESEDGKLTASVEIDYTGNPDSVHVEEVTNMPELLGESMPGYIGNAFDFSADTTFERATISYSFDSSVLGDDAEPTIYYFNEENQTLTPLETEVNGSTASAVVEHFSIYILLDKKIVDKHWEEEFGKLRYESDTKLDISFVIDYSASMDDNDPSYNRKDIVKNFIDKLRTGIDKVSVTKFAAYATTIVPLTYDKIMAKNAVDGITNASSSSCDGEAGTNGSDGLHAAIEELKPSDGTKKVIVFLTDGEDTKTSYDYDELIDDAASNGITIYSVGMGDCNTDLLTKIAEGTQGKCFYASTADKELAEAFSEIEDDSVDRDTDSNNDGISDYYTRQICNGDLKTMTGIKLFENVSFDEIQADEDGDYDNDGKKNGEEFSVEFDSGSGRTYLRIYSSPVLIDSDGDGYIDGEDENPLFWDVGDRDLAMFASLCYEDGKTNIGRFYKPEDIVGQKPGDRCKDYDDDDNYGQRYYWLDFANLRELSEQWTILDFEGSQEEGFARGFADFSATTYNNSDNYVIAYRGTDAFGEWFDDILCYGLTNYHLEELSTQRYVDKIYNRYIKGHPERKLYITGHSLGGYLAQVGTAHLMLFNEADQLERTAYFNGIGMRFNKTNLLDGTKRLEEAALIKFGRDMESLDAAPNGKLISYSIQGDPIHLLGTHYGDKKEFKATQAALDHHALVPYKLPLGAEGPVTAIAIGLYILLLKPEIEYYYNSDYYDPKPKNFIEHMWRTHETDSFLFHLTQGQVNLSERYMY